LERVKSGEKISPLHLRCWHRPSDPGVRHREFRNDQRQHRVHCAEIEPMTLAPAWRVPERQRWPSDPQFEFANPIEAIQIAEWLHLCTKNKKQKTKYKNMSINNLVQCT
jgi:hypothetical protein